MKIFVTGGAGFIGSAFIRFAISKKIQILNFDNLTYASSNNNLFTVQDNKLYKFIKGNICDRKLLTKEINDFKPDIIINFAAESHVDRSIDNPKSFIDTNISGTYELLEATRKYYKSHRNLENFKFLHVSTDEVYGSLGKYGHFTELSKYDPRSPYSASKAASDHLVQAWHHTYNLPTIITNCSNNYGPFHFPEKFIPVVIINAILGRDIPIYGNGKNLRDWIYVDDHIKILSNIIDKGKVGEKYNIGTKKTYKNITIAKFICKILDKKLPKKNLYENQIKFVNDRPGHDFRYSIDPKKIIKEFNLNNFTSIEEGLDNTVEWYLNNQNWWKPLLSVAGVGDRLGII